MNTNDENKPFKIDAKTYVRIASTNGESCSCCAFAPLDCDKLKRPACRGLCQTFYFAEIPDPGTNANIRETLEAAETSLLGISEQLHHVLCELEKVKISTETLERHRNALVKHARNLRLIAENY